jgi:hypothetical protein
MSTVDLIRQVRSYTASHAELRNAHHFLFDFPLYPDVVEADYIVMGINPGKSQEQPINRQMRKEEISECDFRQVRSNPSRARWQRHCEWFLESRNIFLTELFFWTSRDLVDFANLYGE